MTRKMFIFTQMQPSESKHIVPTFSPQIVKSTWHTSQIRRVDCTFHGHKYLANYKSLPLGKIQS